MQASDDFSDLAGQRARNLFQSGQLLCSEAVLAVLNKALRGGLDTGAAVRLASGLPQGMGGSGCTCGALSGGVLALGLFLGRSGPGIGNNREVMQAASALHEVFKSQYGSTCCRVLCKKYGKNGAADPQHCAELTAFAAQAACRIICEKRPGLASDADREYLLQNDSRLEAGLKRIAGLFSREKQ